MAMQTPALAKPLLAPLGPGGRALGVGLETLLVCNEFDAGSMRELLTGTGRVVTGSPSGSMILGLLGRCFNMASQGIAGNNYGWSAPTISNSIRYTLMSVVRWTGSDGAGFDDFWCVVNSSKMFNGIGSSAASGNFAYRVNYGTAVTLSGPAKETTAVHVMIGITRSSTVHELWLDGALVASSTSSTGSTIASRTTAMIGSMTGLAGQGAEHYLDAAWGRDLLPAEIAELTADPWQLVDWGIASDSWLGGATAGGGAAPSPFPYRPRVWTDYRLRR